MPPFVLRQDQVAEAAARLFAGSAEERERLLGIYRNTGIETRHSVVPLDWYLEPHGFAERNALFLRHATQLAAEAASAALAKAGLEAREVDALVSVSSTGIATPALDARLLARLPLRADLLRVPVFGLGCAGGVLGLARAADLALARPGRKVLLVVVELCGLTFRLSDRSRRNVVATALFGDGAAAALLSTQGSGPALIASGEHTWPNSLDIMGWDVGADGLGVIFTRAIPGFVRAHFRPVLDRFLAASGLTLADIDALACHPGGARVLDALADCLGAPAAALDPSRRVLARFGNMSAPTALFVLAELLERAPCRCLLSALGPGFSAAFALLERQ